MDTELSTTQWKMIRFLSREPQRGSRQVAGYGAGPRLSACRALVRKGLAYAATRTGYYGLTVEGEKLVDMAFEILRNESPA
ncbi:hypothetical protein PLUTO_00420 [Luteibacter phage vB_LflM-Pluto]|uniref:Uncharacterized protein n=1 Tax=Luteibacter phage vB_LflM-Pluto TaxID=2948611 RepID=A0A9E7SL82_9CAUD|nr:hypothetical protein PLUTO_00420 [Luteibacter phage vB_LflM-Pluto]